MASGIISETPKHNNEYVCRPVYNVEKLFTWNLLWKEATATVPSGCQASNDQDCLPESLNIHSHFYSDNLLFRQNATLTTTTTRDNKVATITAFQIENWFSRLLKLANADIKSLHFNCLMLTGKQEPKKWSRTNFFLRGLCLMSDQFRNAEF